ncbi:nuclear transport factor 2 family protein [bacterium]|nr:nuclear transport factor 2 family protein [bacterium]
MARKSVENEIMELEKKYWQAMKDNDAQTCASLTDEPCLLAGPQGAASIGRDALVSMFNDGKWTLKDFQFRGEPKVRMLGRNAAVVAYQVHETGEIDGRPFELDAAESSTWVRHNGQWLCAAHSESLIGDPFGRDRNA